MNLKFLSWQEGKYSDLWFFIHFCSGVVGGTAFLLLGLKLETVLLIFLLSTIGWEIGEWKYGIKETLYNRFLDIVTAFLGGFLGYVYLDSLQLSLQTNYFVFFFEAFTLIFLSTLGWKKYPVKN